ncbi:hypothetical protein J3458_013245 [Metarhizium acridum]|uniref:uncharacterized protein n=1 Tax=Metarhizium acridum TaxID=92637 RepID=UPI001C6C1ACE|nr:hypothetical protein J3458_013245 [Metarhizium acridum]
MADLIKNFPKLPPEVQLKILNGPAMAPPPGVSSNLDDPSNHTVMGIAFGAACVTVASIAIMFHIYCKTKVLKRWRVEDSIGCLAFLVYIGAATSYFLCIHFGGFLVHQWNIRYKEFQIVLQNALAITICYGTMTMFAKVAILLEWNRIFNPNRVHSGFFWASHILLAVNILLYTSLTFASMFSCWPVHFLWEPWVKGYCINKRALDLASAYFNLVADLFILLLPQKVIWTLRMSRQRKLGVSAIFSVGILTCLCAIGRIILIHPLKYAGDGDTNNQISQIFLLSIAEATLVLLIFCMPAIPKGFKESLIGRGILYCLHSLASIRFSRKGCNGSAAAFENSGRHGSKLGEEFDSSSNVYLNDPEKQSPGGSQGHARSDRVIFRRVDIESQHELANVKSKAALVSKQYPWAEGRELC